VELLHLIFEESPMNRLRVTATELLGKGFPVWSNCSSFHYFCCGHIIPNIFFYLLFTVIVDTGSLIQKLLKLTLVLEPKGLGKAAKRALMLIAAREPRRFIQSVGHRFAEALTKGASIGTEMMGPKEHAQALILLGRLVKKHPMEFLIELPLLIESVVRSLDPHVPLLREVSLKPATSLVHDLVMRYPMVSFDQEEQRLAVGTKEGVIFIYDLNSATRWHVLEGHKSGIASLAFSETGKILASYSVDEGLVKLWKTSQSFLGILGSDPHCYKNITVAKPESTAFIGWSCRACTTTTTDMVVAAPLFFLSFLDYNRTSGACDVAGECKIAVAKEEHAVASPRVGEGRSSIFVMEFVKKKEKKKKLLNLVAHVHFLLVIHMPTEQPFLGSSARLGRLFFLFFFC
jgi:hypothetical protein